MFLKKGTKGRFRERVAEFIIDAAEKLNDTNMLLMGRRERFFSRMSDQNLLDLMDEAIRQDVKVRLSPTSTGELIKGPRRCWALSPRPMR